ncbi:hypothetical protein [Mycobacterium sp. TY815]|uniref:hypothetical protein n=1 Tax=Mycobacterium sp. TY815 TaxID=3050581 RepID=UPI002740E3F7|nr:hypothetical protein [Mycobacterium sp. TY815]MDP7707407.1 hypothetical protein [Mycobacterium sp. TY815]
MQSRKPHSQKAQRTKLLGIRLLPDEHESFKDLADGQGGDMSELVYDALAAKYPHIFIRSRSGVTVAAAV